MVNTLDKRILSSPDICGGAPCVAGTRIRVQDIVLYHDMYGWSADQIIRELEGLTLADVHSTLAYYYDNIDEFRKEQKEEETYIDQIRAKAPSLLKQKLAHKVH